MASVSIAKGVVCNVMFNTRVNADATRAANDLTSFKVKKAPKSLTSAGDEADVVVPPRSLVGLEDSTKQFIANSPHAAKIAAVRAMSPEARAEHEQKYKVLDTTPIDYGTATASALKKYITSGQMRVPTGIRERVVNMFNAMCTEFIDVLRKSVPLENNLCLGHLHDNTVSKTALGRMFEVVPWYNACVSSNCGLVQDVSGMLKEHQSVIGNCDSIRNVLRDAFCAVSTPVTRGVKHAPEVMELVAFALVTMMQRVGDALALTTKINKSKTVRESILEQTIQTLGAYHCIDFIMYMNAPRQPPKKKAVRAPRAPRADVSSGEDKAPKAPKASKKK